MNKYLVILALSISSFSCVNLSANNKISVSHGKYSDYYHIQYTLTSDNFTIPKDNDPSYNGQFEILLNKSNFPIRSKSCNSSLILRMPSTLKDSKCSESNINEKVALYNDIKNVKNGKKKSINIIVELNPYVLVKSKEPLVLELKNCNIFFRTNKNKYINKL